MAQPGVDVVRLEVPDYDLGLRGKAVRPDKAAAGKRISFCTIVCTPMRMPSRTRARGWRSPGGRAVAESPRTVVRRLVDEFATLGLQPVFGCEYEVYVAPAADAAPGAVFSDGLEPGPAFAAGDDLAVAGGDLPADLLTAVDRFEASLVARAYLGEEFVTTYALTRRAEVAVFDRWLSGSVTDWETNRYPDHL